MVRIANLLFATTILTIFCYLLFFTSMAYTGNGGKYWGFDGHLEPWRAAADAFEVGDYRFLEVALPDANGTPVRYVPLIAACESHPFGEDNMLRPSSSDPIHGPDSIRLASDFAYSFNSRMATFLEYELGIECLEMRRR